MFMWYGGCGRNTVLCSEYCLFDICTLMSIKVVRTYLYIFFRRAKTFRADPRGRPLVRIVGSNHAGGVDVCLF